MPYGSVKLAPRRHGPFPITQVISPVTYKLALPHQWTIHPMFHASLLTPYSEIKEHGENYSQPPPDLVGDVEQYEVEAIHSHQRQGKGKQLQYLVKWFGYPKSNNTWEPAGHLQTLTLLKEYHHQVPVESIKSTANQGERHLPSWLPHLTRPTATTPSTCQPSTGTSHLQCGILTMATPPNHQHLEKEPSAANRKSDHHSNTARPTQPFVKTLSAPSTTE